MQINGEIETTDNNEKIEVILEVYRQWIEAARTSYRLELQFLQVGTAIGLLALTLGKDSVKPEWWQLLISGTVFVGFTCAVQRMAYGFKNNLPHLLHYAKLVGDPGVHKRTPWWTSAAVWSRLILHTVGVFLIAFSVKKNGLISCSVSCSEKIPETLIYGAMLLEWLLWLIWQVFDICERAKLLIRWIQIIFKSVGLLTAIVIPVVAIYFLFSWAGISEHIWENSCYSATP